MYLGQALNKETRNKQSTDTKEGTAKIDRDMGENIFGGK